MSINDWLQYNEGSHPLQEKPSDVIEFSPADAREGIIVEGDARPADEEPATYHLGADGYIRKHGDPKILGRVSGYGKGTCWYQLAAKPYDEPSVMGFDSIWKAFDAAVAALQSREGGA